MTRVRLPARRVVPLLACVALLLAAAASRGQDVGTKIVGGTTAEPDEYPWQIALYWQQNSNFVPSFICGGTLIADRRVVTAAHCTPKSGNLKVLVGTQTLNSSGPFIDVSSYEDHPSYNQNTDRFDAAVLQLADSGIAAGGQPLSLIGAEGSADDALWAADKLLAISGWGTTSEGGAVSNQLRKARVPRVADDICGQNDWYGTDFHAGTMVCAGFEEGGVDTCQGDSGGPLMASTQDPPPASENNPSQWRLAGITSWGFGCARAEKPGVYTRVAAPTIRSWIVDTSSLVTLTVNVTGTGGGTVTSTDGNIDCPPACSFGYVSDTDVTLAAHEASGSTFTRWTGACTGTTATCTVDMTEARSVTAEFTSTSSTPTLRTLTVEKQGGGSGTVTSNPPGINCGATCSASFDHGTSATLAAAPASGSTFVGWDGGGCSGTGTCVVLMDQARAVSATFGLQIPGEPPPDDSPPSDGGSTSDPADSTSGSDDPLDTGDATASPVVAITSGARLDVSRRGYVRVPIDCERSQSGRCKGEVRLRARLPVAAVTVAARRMRTIGRKSFRIEAGDGKRVKLRLTRRARRVLRKQRRLRARIVVVVTNPAGGTRKFRKKVTLRAQRPRAR